VDREKTLEGGSIVTGKSQQKRAVALARLAREASSHEGARAGAWREIQEAFALDVAPSLRLEKMLLRSLATAGEVEVAAEGLELHGALHAAIAGDRDFRGHLSVTAALLEELVRFERDELAAAKSRLLAPAAAMRRPETMRARVPA
jgi:hypothetical protein